MLRKWGCIVMYVYLSLAHQVFVFYADVARCSCMGLLRMVHLRKNRSYARTFFRMLEYCHQSGVEASLRPFLKDFLLWMIRKMFLSGCLSLHCLQFWQKHLCSACKTITLLVWSQNIQNSFNQYLKNFYPFNQSWNNFRPITYALLEATKFFCRNCTKTAFCRNMSSQNLRFQIEEQCFW